ncbi:unnamed protein product [Cochlearia groenlandica]
MARKSEARGGRGGSLWDDGADYENVSKIHVRGGLEGVQFIKFEYVKDKKTSVGPTRGVYGKGFTQTFEMNHNEEHLISVKGCYDTTSVFGSKITGFHGSTNSKNLTSLGAYFTPFPPIKLGIQGGSGGNPWDHGVYTGVRKVCVTNNPPGRVLPHHGGISQIMVDYDKSGNIETRQIGDRLGENRAPGQVNEFAVDYPNEYITQVEGTSDRATGIFSRVRSLSFKTSKDRTSPTYGKPGERAFVLESKGRALVGFHGRAGWAIDAIGAYFGPVPIPLRPPVEKLQGKGVAGVPWDDGAFDGVRKIYVGQGENGVASVKFVYDNNNKAVLGEARGKRTLLGYEECELDYPNEYITAVEGFYDKIFGNETGVIVMLRFKTNKRTSPPFGMSSDSNFVLGKEGHKVVGFHGKASHELHHIGVSVSPITT